MKTKKFPSFSQWKQLFKVLKKSEKRLLIVFLFLTFFSGSYLLMSLYYKNTKITPALKGTFKEGVIGQPRFLNPIYGEINDIDRSLINLIYSGLMKYDNEGKLVPDLAEKYYVSEDGKTYTFELKENIYWHDGKPLTVEDIIYTIKTIQLAEYKSPLRPMWLNVDVQKLTDRSLSFILKTPYSSFLENTTLKIIPKHIWENVAPENFALSVYNLQPIGSGPYLLKSIEQDKNGFIKNVRLLTNEQYYNKPPYLKEILFIFFKNKEDFLKAATQKKIDGFAFSSLENSYSLKKELEKKYIPYSLLIPRYFAVFFNSQNSKIFSDKNLIQALNYAINKKELVEKIKEEFKEEVFVLDSPFLPDYFGWDKSKIVYNFNIERSEKLLDENGYLKRENGIRAKTNPQKPSFQFKNYLKVGSKGKEVNELQACLIRLDSSFQELLKDNPSDTYTQKTEQAVMQFQKKYLPNENPTGETGPATRKKLNELCFKQPESYINLSFNLLTVNQPLLIKTAEILKEGWKKIGVEVKIEILETPDLKEKIKKREYEALLYGQALGSLPDPYPFWHSSQINDPGLNLCGFQNKDADQLIKEIRENTIENLKKEKYQKLQDIILSQAPVVFLYNINYSYWLSPEIKGFNVKKIVDPSQRFTDISNWYLSTRRVWKQ